MAYKDFLKNSIVKEMKIVRRLATKIVADQENFRPKEGIRSITELLQYLSMCGTHTIAYWYRSDMSVDFKTFVTPIAKRAKAVTARTFVAAMDLQIAELNELFEHITDADLLTKEVDYPWGETAQLGEAIIETSIKFLTAYKMQLFLKLKLSSELELKTPDLWRKTEIEVA